MGRRYFIDNSIDYPSTMKVDVIEKKAPTDESVRYMEDAHNKAIENIISKVKVDNNLVSGECFCVEQPWNLHDVKLVFKFKINGNDFVVEKEISRMGLEWDDSKEIRQISLSWLKGQGESVMLWYMLKMFCKVAFEQITKTQVPDFVLK